MHGIDCSVILLATPRAVKIDLHAVFQELDVHGSESNAVASFAAWQARYRATLLSRKHRNASEVCGCSYMFQIHTIARIGIPAHQRKHTSQDRGELLGARSSHRRQGNEQCPEGRPQRRWERGDHNSTHDQHPSRARNA